MKRKFFKFLLILGILQFINPILYGILCFYDGFNFMSSYSYGFEGMYNAIFFWSYFFWISYLIGIILIIVSIKKIKKLNKELSNR